MMTARHRPPRRRRLLAGGRAAATATPARPRRRRRRRPPGHGVARDHGVRRRARPRCRPSASCPCRRRSPRCSSPSAPATRSSPSTAHSDYPAGTPMTDLSGFRPNVEAIGGYEPDLVVVASDRDGIVAALGRPSASRRSCSSADTPRRRSTTRSATARRRHRPRRRGRRPGRGDARPRSTELPRAGRCPDGEAPLRYYYELSDDDHSADLGRPSSASVLASPGW